MRKFISIVIFIILSCSSTNIFAKTNILENNTNIKIGEEYSFSVNIDDIKVSAFDLEIKFDSNLLEYVSGPENTNVINNKIITVWYDEQGGSNAKTNCELVKYTFKARELGNASISIDGNFFDETGIKKENVNQGIQVNIEEEKENENISTISEESVENNNSKLKELRLNEEGILPVFNPDTTEYYFYTETLNYLEVTAIPQNSNSIVDIVGNNNFKYGSNIIEIKVTSPDKTTSTIYKINVTKTKNLETANSKLENLAIENAILTPEFNNDIFSYNTEVSDKTENLNILAIPERQESKVIINGGNNLQYGNNQIEIVVTAENGYTNMKYIVNVYRRNEEEQKQYEEEVKENKKKVETLLVSANEENVLKKDEDEILRNEKERKMRILSIIIVVIVLVLGIIAFYIYRKKKLKI